MDGLKEEWRLGMQSSNEGDTEVTEDDNLIKEYTFHAKKIMHDYDVQYEKLVSKIYSLQDEIACLQRNTATVLENVCFKAKDRMVELDLITHPDHVTVTYVGEGGFLVTDND